MNGPILWTTQAGRFAAATGSFVLAALWAQLAAAALPATPVTRRVETFSNLGIDLHDRAEAGFDLHGLLRSRFELLGNLDLDHGLTPSGQPLYPVPLSDPSAQVLTHADMRLRLDLSAFAPRGVVAVRGRVDVLDNVRLGSAPDGPPTAARGQLPDPAPLRVRRLWGEALLPFGVLAAGRMGSHWGLGLLTHGGDCHDCDSGDAADRVALAVPALGGIFGAAWDFAAVGPGRSRPSGIGSIDVDPRDDVRTLTFAYMRPLSPSVRARRHAAGRTTFETGLWLSRRWQEVDVPASWVVGASGETLDPGQVVARGFVANAADLWFRLERRGVRVEFEGAVLSGGYDETTLMPGTTLATPVRSLQWVAALESRFGAELEGFSFGLDAGAASGDPAPGFGVRQPIAGTLPRAGDLDGPQADPPRDARLDNFRLHPDARIDRILFREIVGTVTDAAWARPHLRWAGHVLGDTRMVADLAMVASFAMEPNSTPSGARALGVEIDPTISLDLRGLLLEWQWAVLLPGAAFDNAFTGARAQPAWMSRLFLGFAF
ncbi:MAG: hypothetical protein RIT45_1200 [Pseudomonadota bacterium]|jgi:uncharacterized protein (TIGR04551 family)